MQARLGALQEQLASARSAPAKQTIVALQTSRPATWMGYVEKNRRLVRAARVSLRLQHRRLATAWAMWEAQWHEDKRMRHAAVLRRRQNPALALVSGAGRWRDVRLKSSRMAWSRGALRQQQPGLWWKLRAVASAQRKRRGFRALVLGEWLKEARRSRLVKTAAEAKEAARLFQEAREAEAAAKRKDAAAEAEAKRQRRGRGIDARLSDARMADLDEVSKRLRKRLEFLAAQRDKRGRGRWRRRDMSPAAASSAGQRGKRGRGHWRRRDRWPAAASSEELAAGSESQVALMLQAPGEAAGSFLMAPGEVFASLAVAVVDAHVRATMRRRAQAWVRLRELVRKAASRRFAWFGSALWLQAFDSRRRREAGDEPAMTVRLTHPEAMGREWGVDIAVYPSETAGSVRAYALGILACCELIPGARARRWTSARIRKVRARADPESCDAGVRVLVRFGERAIRF